MLAASRAPPSSDASAPFLAFIHHADMDPCAKSAGARQCGVLSARAAAQAASETAAAELLREEELAAQHAQRSKDRTAAKRARQKQRKQASSAASLCMVPG